MNKIVQLITRRINRNVEIVEAYLQSIEADESQLARMFEEWALAHRRTDMVMEAAAERIKANERRTSKWPARLVLFGDGPIPAPDIETLCGMPMPRKEVERIMAMNAEERVTALAAHVLEHPEHKALFQSWLNETAPGQGGNANED